MSLIGITGGIGSGKSTVLQLLRELGAAGWDADEAVHELYRAGGEGLRRVAEQWGREVLLADGTLDRKAMAQRVFSCPQERERLEELIHPLVRRHMLETAAAAKGDSASGEAAAAAASTWSSRSRSCACSRSEREATKTAKP